MFKTLLLVGAPFKSWSDVVRILLESNYKVIVIGWRAEEDDWRKFNVSFLRVEDQWKLDRDYSSLNNLNLHSFNSLSVDILLSMYDRLESVKYKFSYNSRVTSANLELNYWKSFLEKECVDLIVYTNIPHRIWDYALYMVAERQYVSQFAFALSPFDSNVFVYSDIHGASIRFDTSTLCSEDESFDLLWSRINNNFNLPANMIRQSKINRLGIISDLQRVTKKFKNRKTWKWHWIYKPNTYKLTKRRELINVEPVWKGWIQNGIRKRKFLLDLKRNYSLFSSKSLPSDFYYFPLHYQPEETTLPSGNGYHNQIILIGQILDLLPKGSKLVVKEHPTQFRTSHEGESNRTLDYYEYIKRLYGAKVVLADMSFRTDELILKSSGVITITGTVGIEAASLGKKVLGLGRIWYEEFPNIFSEVEHFLTANPLQLSKNDWYVYTQELRYRLISCRPYKSHNNSDITISESTKNLVKFIKDVSL